MMHICRLNVFLWVGVLLLSFLSCERDGGVEQALKLAGNNRPELEKVLERYKNNPADSLKYKAACFLIENMSGHYSHNDMAEARYYDRLDSIFTLYKGDNEKLDSEYAILAKQWAGMSSKRIADLHCVTADYLIDNIEMAFEVWQNGRWAKHVNFDDFCESILPYKAEDGQILDNWRKYLATFCSGSLTYLSYCPQYSHSAYRACEAVNQALIDTVKPRWYGISAPLVLRLSTLMKMSHGMCNSYSFLATSVMRAKGIPVFTDFTPQWPCRGSFHMWNVVMENSGRYIAFEGAYTPIEQLFKKEQKMAKVFRKTYAMNSELKEMMLSGQYLPPAFRTPFIRDASDDYFVGRDVTLPVNRQHGLQYAFLSVFNNHSWIPVHWGKIKKNEVVFKNMGRDIVYLPVFYEKEAVIPFSDPFLLDLNGNALPIIPDTIHKQTLTLTRKFPVFFFQYEYEHGPKIIGSRFEAADNPDFKNPVVVHEIQEFFTESKVVAVNPATESYRYWRFYPPDSVFYNIAEICFYERDSIKPSYGKVIGTNGSYRKEAGYTKEAVFDGDLLTFFDVPEAGRCWVGMDFGKAVSMEKIIYTPRSAGNCIEIGDEYELVFWCEGKWKSLGKQKATDVTITFEHCPTNALFLLHDLTKGKDERIFTYENGMQVWW